MKHKKLCIFDLDGTLVNSLADLANAVNQGLTRMGYPTHQPAAYMQMVGNGARILCRRALPPDATETEEEALYEMFSSYYAVHALDNTVPYEGIPALLDALKADNRVLAVATNKPQAFAERIISQLFGDQLFSLVRGGCGKPDTSSIDALLDATGTACSDAVLLGDSNVDIFTAKNAGIASVGCCWGFRCEQELRDAGAEILIHSPADAVKILLG